MFKNMNSIQFSRSSVGLNFFGGYLERKSLNIEESITLFEKCRDGSKELNQMALASIYEIGESHHVLEHWAESIKYCQEFLSRNKAPSYACWCSFLLGMSYCMLGQNDKAVQAFQKTPALARKHYTYDQYAARKSAQYIKSPNQPVDKFELLHYVANLRRRAGKFKESLEILEEAKEHASDNQDYLCAYYYLKGKDLHLLGQDSEAQKALRLAMEQTPKYEIYLVPHACFELAEILKDSNQEEAIMWLQKARTYHSYDFDKPLVRRILRMLDELKIDE